MSEWPLLYVELARGQKIHGIIKGSLTSCSSAVIELSSITPWIMGGLPRLNRRGLVIRKWKHIAEPSTSRDYNLLSWAFVGREVSQDSTSRTKFESHCILDLLTGKGVACDLCRTLPQFVGYYELGRPFSQGLPWRGHMNKRLESWAGNAWKAHRCMSRLRRDISLS